MMMFNIRRSGHPGYGRCPSLLARFPEIAEMHVAEARDLRRLHFLFRAKRMGERSGRPVNICSVFVTEKFSARP